MEGLSIYWNIGTKLFYDHELIGQEILDYFLVGISTKNQTVSDYMYSTYDFVWSIFQQIREFIVFLWKQY